MTKYKSLLYREFCLARKNTVMGFISLLLIEVFFMFGLSGMPEEEAQLALIMVNATICALVAALTNTAMNFMPDIKSGWLKYSYTLPVTPSDRAKAISSVKIIISSVGMVFSVIFAALNCRIAGVKLTGMYPVLFIIIYVIMQAGSIIQNFFIYSARTAGEFKKKNNEFAVVIAVVSGIIVYFLSKTLEVSEALNISITVKMLVWLIPLLIVLTAADYFVIRNRLLSPASAMSEKNHGKSVSNERLSLNNGFHLKGNLYKEVKQNRIMILVMVLLPFFAALFSLLIAAYVSGNEFLDIVYYLCLVLSMFIVSSVMSNIFMNDSKKIHGYFIIASPNGVKNHIMNKYLIGIILTGVFTAASIVSGGIYRAVCGFITGMNVKISFAWYMLIALVIPVTLAFDVPFIIRFGVKRGSLLKTISMIVISTIIIVFAVYAPESMKYNIMETLSGIWDKIKLMDIKKLKSAAMIVLPLVCAVIYALSYKISCALFKKGIEC